MPFQLLTLRTWEIFKKDFSGFSEKAPKRFSFYQASYYSEAKSNYLRIVFKTIWIARMNYSYLDYFILLKRRKTRFNWNQPLSSSHCLVTERNGYWMSRSNSQRIVQINFVLSLLHCFVVSLFRCFRHFTKSTNVLFLLPCLTSITSLFFSSQ